MQRIAGNMLLVLAAITIGFLISEGALRLYKIKYPGFLQFQEITYLAPSNFQGLYFELKPGHVLTGTSPYNLGVEVRINSCGFRGSEEDCRIFLGKQPQQYPLIVGVGDSFMLGSSVPSSKTFMKIAEKELRRNIPFARTLNFGTGNYNASQEYSLLRNKILPALKPDIVVWQFLLNDVFPIGQFSWENSYSASAWVGKLRKHTLTGRLIADAIQRGAPRGKPIPRTYGALRTYMHEMISSPQNWKSLQTVICDAYQLIRSSGSAGVFLYVPYTNMLERWADYGTREREQAARVKRLATDCGWHVADATAELETQPLEDVILAKDQDHHLNVFGHEIVGRYLAKTLSRYIAR